MAREKSLAPTICPESTRMQSSLKVLTVYGTSTEQSKKSITTDKLTRENL